eukprot:g1464.t1
MKQKDKPHEAASFLGVGGLSICTCSPPSTTLTNGDQSDDSTGNAKTSKKRKRNNLFFHSYRRPKNRNEPTPHIFICNVGTNTPPPNNGTDIAKRLSARFGPILHVELDASRTYATFQTKEAAQMALEASRTKTGLFKGIDRKIVVAYAEKRNKSERHSDAIGSSLPRSQSTPPPTEQKQNTSITGKQIFPLCTCVTRHISVPGLYVIPNFITEQEEKELLHYIDCQAWQTGIKRRVQHYGYAFDYKARTVDRNQLIENPIPSPFVAIISRLRDACNKRRLIGSETKSIEPPLENDPLTKDLLTTNLFTKNSLTKDLERKKFLKESLRNLLAKVNAFNQITINEYQSGVGINPHIDTHSAFGDFICSLSLNSATVMDMRKVANEDLLKQSDLRENGNQKRNYSSLWKTRSIWKQVNLPRRSMLILSGDARWRWTHGIAHRKSDRRKGVAHVRERRVSITFREIRTNACPCELCVGVLKQVLQSNRKIKTCETD